MAAAFRLYSELDTFYGQSGQLLSGGYLTFCEAGTATPKDVFGEEAISTNNGNTVALDSSGRPSVDIWGSGSYFVELFDADDVKQGEADDVQVPGGEATALPALSTDKFLTNDGSVMSWATIRQVPDPTGSAEKVLSTDGTSLLWIAKTEIPTPADPDIVVDDTAHSFLAGLTDDPTKFYALGGSGTAPATNALTSSVAIAFDPGFGALWTVLVSPTTSGVTSNSPPALPSWSVTGYTPFAASTGATVTFYAPPVQTISSEDNIVSTIPFTWIAIGTREVAP